LREENSRTQCARTASRLPGGELPPRTRNLPPWASSVGITCLRLILEHLRVVKAFVDDANRLSWGTRSIWTAICQRGRRNSILHRHSGAPNGPTHHSPRHPGQPRSGGIRDPLIRRSSGWEIDPAQGRDDGRVWAQRRCEPWSSSPSNYVPANTLPLALASVAPGERRLRRSELGDRHAVGRAGDVVSPTLAQKWIDAGSPPCSPQMPSFRLPRVLRPRSAAIFTTRRRRRGRADEGSLPSMPGVRRR